MKYKYTEKQLHSFLRESNAIEQVYDEASLQQAIFAWNYIIKEKELDPHIILKTHKILMLNQPLMPNEKGYFRRCEVVVGGRYGLEHTKIPDAIQHWCNNVNDVIKNGQKENLGFLDNLITKQHIEYEKIHPFVDGNGRTGRIFLNWTRMKVKYLQLLIIKEDDKWEYYKLFKDNEKTS